MPSQNPLTERTIRDLKPDPGAGNRRQVVWDGTLPGFGVRVFATGAKSYVLAYRVGKRFRIVKLARVGELPLKEMRKRAGALLVDIRNGGTDPLDSRRAARETPTVNDGLDRFFTDYAPTRIEQGRLRESTLKEYRQQARRSIQPTIGNKRIQDVNRVDIERLLLKIKAHVQRNRTLALLSRLFNLFEAWELRPMHSNPCRRIDKVKEQARERILSFDELATLAKALDDAEEQQPVVVNAVRVAATTGLRISEVLGIRWKDVDFRSGRLQLTTTKTGARSHDLPSAALSILASMPRINDWAFTIVARGPLGYSHTRKVFADIVRAAGLDDLRLHDLRRTALTTAAMAGFSALMVKELAGHKTLQMASRYVQLAGSDPVKRAREQVGATIAAAMEGKISAVVETRSR